MTETARISGVGRATLRPRVRRPGGTARGADPVRGGRMRTGAAPGGPLRYPEPGGRPGRGPCAAFRRTHVRGRRSARAGRRTDAPRTGRRPPVVGAGRARANCGATRLWSGSERRTGPSSRGPCSTRGSPARRRRTPRGPSRPSASTGRHNGSVLGRRPWPRPRARRSAGGPVGRGHRCSPSNSSAPVDLISRPSSSRTVNGSPTMAETGRRLWPRRRTGWRRGRAGPRPRRRAAGRPAGPARSAAVRVPGRRRGGGPPPPCRRRRR